MESRITIKVGNLLDATEHYICHQCNCSTIRSKHLAQQVFNKFNYANTYKDRTYDPKSRSIPGTIDVFYGEKIIINMYGQYYPGNSKYPNDSYQLRITWFESCLKEITKIEGIQAIAMPFNIGCGSAGGDWNEYYKRIEQFVNSSNVEVVLYKLS